MIKRKETEANRRERRAEAIKKAKRQQRPYR
jgi:hypothetical protein